MSKYTPGPWKAETYGTKTTIEIKSLVVEDVPAVVSWQGFDDCFRPRKEHLANARLIAAAPRLHQELANALVLIRLKYGNLDPEVWAWQQKVSELLKSLKVE